jgi:peptidyl-prolyl cis-trans isomerase D
MMTQMRQMSKAIFVIVGLAFIGLIVFEWGAGGAGGPDSTVGKVNGQKLSFNEYNELYKQLYENERAAKPDGQIDDRQLEQLKNQVWEQFIQRVLLTEQMENLNIAVTDSEVVYQIMNYPMDQIKQNPSLQTNGIFDMQKYRAALNDPNIPWGQIEAFYRQQIPYSKLQNLITSSVRISPSEVKDEFIRKNVKAKVEYLSIMASLFQTGIEVNDDELLAYYNEHKEEYKQEEMRDLAYVIFEVKPTKNDTTILFDEFDAIKERLDLGEDFATIALELSEDPSAAQNNGDLGYFDRGAMVKPFSDAAFAAKVGEIVGPIKTQFGYHLIKIEDKKKEKGVEKVKASHILLKITAGNSTRFAQEDLAKSFAKDAEEIGWDEAAAEGGYEVKTTGNFEERSGFVPGFQRNPAITHFAFTKDEGDISTAFSIDRGYVVFKLNGIREKGYRTFEEQKNFVTNKVRLLKAKDLARDYAEPLAEKIKSGMAFKQIAESDTSKKVKYDVTPMFSLNQTISGGVGRSAEFAATAFTLGVGEVSNLVETDFGFYYEKLLEKTAFDSAAFNVQHTAISARLLNQKRSIVFADWMKNLKDAADIEDNRKSFNIY